MVYDAFHRKLKINVELEYNGFITDYLVRAILDDILEKDNEFTIKSIEITELTRELVKGDDE